MRDDYGLTFGQYVMLERDRARRVASSAPPPPAAMAGAWPPSSFGLGPAAALLLAAAEEYAQDPSLHHGQRGVFWGLVRPSAADALSVAARLVQGTRRFYIGATTNVNERWFGRFGTQLEHHIRYHRMYVLHRTIGASAIDLERRLIAALRSPRCENVGIGGERISPASSDVFLYVCVSD